MLTDGLHQLRLDVRGGTLTRGPVRLHFEFEGLAEIDAALLTLRRLVAVDRRGKIPLGLFAKEPRAGRWIAAARALDAREAGASQRDVAETLFGGERVRADWAGSSDYLRSQVRRMLAFGTRMRSSGWRALLAGKG
ncbi:DUF2285 domain-containing protein [Sphingomonas sp. KR3-1]|uniref:DNA -binding domain-containing protein n=1 Tax=Sphingomonas sp. KR3-1 TaxID=3156611 RepID=UPI0032B3ACD4